MTQFEGLGSDFVPRGCAVFYLHRLVVPGVWG